MMTNANISKLNLGLLCALLLLSTAAVHAGWSAYSVRSSAASIAQSDSYCIQVTGNESDYRPASTLLDLTELRMWAKREGGMYLQRHAVLVVGNLSAPQLFHWSYRKRSFIKETTNLSQGIGIACQPRPKFSDALPVLTAPETKSDFVWFSPEEAYSLPKEYRLQWHGAGRKGSMYILAPSPEFRSQVKTVANLRSEGALDFNWIFVEHNPQWLINAMKPRIRPNELFVAQGEEFGLTKTEIIFKGTDGRNYTSHQFQRYGSAPLESDTTSIVCGQRSCQHRFIHKGRHFYFRHGPEYVHDWREMQQRIVRLFESFAVTS
jgi:hypothetical protein